MGHVWARINNNNEQHENFLPSHTQTGGQTLATRQRFRSAMRQYAALMVYPNVW